MLSGFYDNDLFKRMFSDTYQGVKVNSVMPYHFGLILV